MTANATPNNRRPIRWWYLPTLVVTLFMGFAALTGTSVAAAPLDVPGKAAPAGQAQPYACGPGANYVIVTGTTTLIPGTTDIGNHTDDGTTSITLPFPVTFYKRAFTSVNASSNGNLQFTSNLPAYANECLPTVTNAMNDLIAPHWDDLRTDQQGNCTLYGGVGCGIFTAVLGSAPNRTFVMEWRAVYFSPNTQQANFEVILYEGIDRIDMVYGLVEQGGSSATVGVQRDTGTNRFTSFECNTAGSLSTNLLLIYTPGPCVTDTPTNTFTPGGPANTPTQTGTPTCGPYSDYVITQITGAQLVPGVNLLPGSQGNDVVASIALPFAYHLYEYSPFTTANVNSNGYLQFADTPDAVPNNICLSSTSRNATIFPHWDDLRTDSTLTCTGGCGIYTSLSGNVGNQIFTIEWRAVYASNTAQQANFEVRLYEAEPKFEIIYGTVAQSGSGATVGVMHCAGFFTQFECNTGTLTSGMALIFQQPACGTATATSTPAPPTNTPTNTNTPIPTNTFTPIPPTNTFTPIPPTNTFTPTNTPTNTNTSVPTNTFTPVPPTRTPTNTNTNTPTNTPAANINAYAHLELGGPSARVPPAKRKGAPMLSGITMTLGSRINLDLMINAGSNNVNAAQNYITFTSSILQNVNATQTGCVVSNTVTGDLTTFETQLQNEVCNGPGNCVFRGITVGPGSMAYASGALSNCPNGCTGNFRVAQIAFCAVATGDALIHWQFSPSAPVVIRDSEIVDNNSSVVSNPALYTDLIIHVIQSNLVGHLTWQGVAAANRPLVTGTLTLCVGGAPQNFSFTTDTNGSFTVITGLPDGMYHWRVKGGRHLSNSSPGDGSDLVISGGSATQEFGTQRGGDTNADNVVNSTDFNGLKNDFGHSGVDRADFDYNLVVNTSDFNMLKSNFGQSGHNMTCP